MSSTKRLRVGEIAQLGEKRFVALVTVEGREFLIGGGSTGISLLTPLGAAPQPGEPIQAKFDVGGHSE
jgi:flagellar biogenesis protein FliO